jgi:hypothetical protein
MLNRSTCGHLVDRVGFIGLFHIHLVYHYYSLCHISFTISSTKRDYSVGMSISRHFAMKSWQQGKHEMYARQGAKYILTEARMIKMNNKLYAYIGRI